MRRNQGMSNNADVHEAIFSTGSIVVVILAICALAIGSSSWMYKSYKNHKERKLSLKKSKDNLLNSFLEESDSNSLRRFVTDRNSSQYGSLHEKTSPIEGRNKHLASPIEENDQTNFIWEGNLGSLEFSASYDNTNLVLSISILCCYDLPTKDPQLGTSDPYVKLQLLPEKKQRVKTQIQRKTLNPMFGETFTFSGFTLNQIKATSLHFVVLSFDRFSRDDIIGEVVCPLNELELHLAQEVTIVKEIQPRRFKARLDEKGEILVSICHQPAARVLTVVVLKARNLPKSDATGLAGDPYVKLYLLQNGQRINKKKTHVKKRTQNPVYNQSFSFDLQDNLLLATGSVANSNISTSRSSLDSATVLDYVGLELLVMDYDKVSKNEILGRVVIGPGCIEEKAHQHWQEVIDNPRKQIAEWHKLGELPPSSST